MAEETATETTPATAHPPGRKRRQRRPPRPDLAHWPKPWEFTVRGAVDAEGEAIHELLDETTKPYGWTLPACRWDRVAPFWYVAEIQGYLLGAIQICVGWPVGRIELLAIRPKLSRTKKAKVLKALIYHAFNAMRRDGTELACGLVAENKDHQFDKILERLGARFAIRGKMYFYSLTAPQKE